MFSLICFVFAFVLACIAAFVAPPTPPTPNWPRILSAALAFFFLALVLGDKLIATRIGN